MNSGLQHPTGDDLQELLDNRDRLPAVREHLESCPQCRELFRVLQRLDQGLTTLPHAAAPEDFTRRIMAGITGARSSPLLLRLFGGLAQLVGLAAVLGIMVGIFLFTGVIDQGEVQRGGSAAQQYMDRLGSVLSGGMASFTQALKTLLPFAFGNESGVLWVLVAVVATGLALADRLLGRRFVSR